MVTITCPHCQFSKEVPQDKLPRGAVRVRCRQCGENFNYDPAVLPEEGVGPEVVETEAAETASSPTGPFEEQPLTELPPVIDLFSRSWALFKQRVWMLLGIYIVTILLTMVPGVGSGILVAVGIGLQGGPGVGSMLLMGIAVLLSMLMMSWGMIAMVYATVDVKLGFKACFGAAKENYWAFCWMFSLLAFVVVGGSMMLFIPGLVFMAWFLFAQYILAVEGEGGMNSLLKSREYVRGYFWAVLLRLLTLWVSTILLLMVLGWIPLLGDLLSLFLYPFTLIYQYLLYLDLRAVRRDKLPGYWQPSVKARWLGLAALGYLVLPTAFWVAGGPELFRGWMVDWQVQHGVISETPEQWTPPAVVEEKLGEAPPTAVKTGRRQMGKLLQQTSVKAPADGVGLGPVAIAVDRFWDSGSAPHLWLKVRLADLPNLELDRDRVVSVSIDMIEGDEGLNRYDADSMFEKVFFRHVALQPATPGVGYLEGIRDVYLRSGTDEDELGRISGTVHLALPVGIEVVDLTPSMMGKDYTVAGHDISYKRLEGPMVKLDLADSDYLLKVVGFNGSGQPLASGGVTSSQHDGLTSRTYMFQGEVFSVRLYVARTLVKKDYPFELKRPEGTRI